MLKIIIVEDNHSYAEDVAEFLTVSGYELRVVANAAAMWQALASDCADLILLDLGLPDDDGFTLLPKLRKLYPTTGIIVLTARVSFDSRVQGLRLGADAYLTKPIKFDELAAHIEAVCRRIVPLARPCAPSGWQLLTEGTRIAHHERGDLPLVEREFTFLHILAQNRLPVPREALLAGMGESPSLEAIKKLDMLVYRLRKKIRTAWDLELPLRSAYGGGFVLSVRFDLI